MEEDDAIESRIVSKTIEGAQTRVEGYNFDMRKRVVEYDDVINKQRETIYEERDKVLNNEDLSDTIASFVDQEIDALVDSHLPTSESIDDWDIDGLAKAIGAMGLTGDELSADALSELNGRDAVALLLRDTAAAVLEEKEQANVEEWALIERLVLLRTIDSIWVEHLTELDELRQGIFLRGFAQEEPLNAFKKEAFSLFAEMTALIRHQLATTIFRVSLVRQPAPQPEGAADGAAATDGTNGAGGTTTEASAAASFTAAATAMQARANQTGAAGQSGVATAGRPLPRALPAGRPMGGAGNGSPGTGAGGTGSAVRPGYTPSGVRIGRNDQCWCGSGKKYKKCHGS